jgi:hypothetical protein
MTSPHYHLVPKSLDANLAFRKEMLALGASSKNDAMALWQMCRDDILFYLNTFGWVYEPRPRSVGANLPFITYSYQDDAIIKLQANLGHDDVLVEKSRDMGASWICLAVIEHAWHFLDGLSFLLLSRIEDLVDKSEDPKALFWKLDHMHAMQPKWLLPAMHRQRMHLINYDLGCTIDGASTTGEAATGDRRTAIMLDEFSKVPDGHAMLSSTRDATDCRIFNSTPMGSADAFAEMRNTMLENAPQNVITLHWSAHPDKAKGIWTDESKTSRFKFRSPWYDEQCKRTPNPVEISRELDIEFAASDYQFFAGVFDKLAPKCTPPDYVGELVDTPEGPRFEVRAGGHLKVWGVIEDGRLPVRQYVIGGDIAMGTGASNTVLSMVDGETKKRVAEWVSKRHRPDQAADEAVRIAKWLATPASSAYMVWERQGPGQAFGNRVIELGHLNVFFHRNEKSLAKKPTDSPGWISTTDNKNALLSEYRRALHAGEYINPSAEAVEELKQFMCFASGEIAHVKSKNNFNPTGTGGNHGDFVIADALSWHAVKTYQKTEQKTEEIMPGSLAFRRIIRQKRTQTDIFW